MIDNIIYTGNIVAPVFLMIALGYFIRRINVINENFVEITSKFVFSVSLPALIFMNISAIDLSEAIDLGQIGYIYLGTLVSFLVIWFISLPFIKEGNDESTLTPE